MLKIGCLLGNKTLLNLTTAIYLALRTISDTQEALIVFFHSWITNNPNLEAYNIDYLTVPMIHESGMV